MKSDIGPFSIVPEWVLLSGVSAEAVRLYALLGRYANSEGEAWPSVETLAKQLRVSPLTVRRKIRELVDLGCLKVTERKAESGGNQSNLYRVIHAKPTTPGCENHAVIPCGGVTTETWGAITPDSRGAITDDSQTITNKNEKVNMGGADEAFGRFWGIYPKRAGANPKAPARTAFMARLKEGTSAEAIIAGAAAYARYCEAVGNTRTPYVKQAQFWLSLSYRGWEEDWAAPPPESSGKREAERDTYREFDGE